MPFFIISILIQVLFVIHIVKTNRPTTWIWIVVMLPMAGSLAYLILEVLPEILSSKSGRQATRKIDSIINPNRDLKAATEQFSIADSVENTKRLADECFVKGLFDDARNLYIKALRGPHAEDPALMYGLAKTEFMLGNYSNTRSTLDKLIEHNPTYKNPDAHLLYARSLDSLGEIDKANHEYEVLYKYFTGPDAAFHYAKFLKANSKNDRATKIFNEILETAKISGKHYNYLHKEIIKQTKSELVS